jgi:isoamylase
MGLAFHLIANSYWESLDFELPKLPDGSDAPWRRWIDTSLETPSDIVEWSAATLI